MKTFHRLLALMIGGLAAMSLAGGCQDANAARRDVVHEELVSAARQLQLVATIQPDLAPQESDAIRRRLEQVIDGLASASNGNGAQQAAASLLIARAHHKLSVIALDKAGWIEASHRSSRNMIGGMIHAAARLQTVTESLEAIDTAPEDVQLDAQRRGAQDLLKQQSQQIAALDGPIAELTSRNRQEQKEVQRLRQQANTFRREAADRGPWHGRQSYEQAVQLDREADRFEYEIAKREIQLRYSLLPQHALAQRSVEALQSRINMIEDAGRSLEDLLRTAVQEAGLSHDQLAELRSRIATILSEVETSSSGELQQRYEQAELALENAAAAAMTAATEDTLADTARIEASGVYQDLGDMHLSAGRGLSEQLLLLQRLAAFVDGADDDGGSTIKELTTARDEALVQARAAYSDAKSQLEMVSATGRAARRLETLKAALDELLATIE